MDIAVIVKGTSYTVSGGELAFLKDFDGLGMADLHRLSERGPLQHGDTDRGYRLDPRFVTLKLGTVASTRSALWDRRAELLNIFKPGTTLIILRITLDNGDIRQLDCHYYGGMNMPSTERRLGIHQNVGVILKANEPSFYDPTAHSLSFSIGGGDGTGVVPMPVPMEVGASRLNDLATITYGGTWISYPHIMRITGPIYNCIIINRTTGEKIDFAGVTIAAGDYYDLDLRFGYKTVKNKAGENVISDLTADSDLATWHLAPDPEASDGINSIRIFGSDVNTNTKIQLTYYDRYIGL